LAAADPQLRVVLDTNTLLRGLVSAGSAAATVRRAAERRAFVPLLSKPVLDEYRAVLSDPAIVAKFLELTPELVEITMSRLRYVGDYVRAPRAMFEYRRDARDQKFIELAISLGATHILSFDKDLLSLPASRTEAGTRFRQRLPSVRVLAPGEFLNQHGHTLGAH
jgi:putative PIN family toxin of toxin-antitoxin system